MRRHLCAGACGSRHMGWMGGPAHQLAKRTSRGLQTSVTPRRVNTFGPQRSDRLILLHHQRLCTQLYPCVCHTWSGIVVLTLGPQLSPLRVVSATITPSPHVRTLVLLPGLKRLGSTDGATLSICCLNASVSLAWTALQHLPSSGMTSSGCVLGRTTRKLAAFPTSRIPVVAATACVVPLLLDPAAALGRMSPWHMKLQYLNLVAAFLLGVSSAVCTRQPPTASMLAHFRLPAWSSVHVWLLRQRTGSDFGPVRLPAPDPVLHMSAPVHRGAVADARQGQA